MPTKTKPSTKSSKLRTGPKEVFLQLMMMAMLYISVISLIILGFAYIDLVVPDLLEGYSGWKLDQIRVSSSMLIVSFPLLLVFSRILQKDLKKFPKKHDLKFSKWLTYITLFVSSITLVISLIILINEFYSGELTLTFALKVLLVLVMAGAVFGYYLWHVQGKPYKSKLPLVMAWVSSTVVLTTLILGFFVAGSPADQRQIRLDEWRVNHLQNIESQVINYWQAKDELPETLEEMRALDQFSIPTDPETKEEYRYELTGALTFNLCANFNQPTPKWQQIDYYGPYGRSENWDHGSGEICFERTIDPDFYSEDGRFF